MKVSVRIKQIREEQSGLSKQEIAQLLGISIQAYYDIEKGVTDISLTRLEEIAKILNVSTSYLLGGKRGLPAFVNNFYNGSGNKEVINIMYQGFAQYLFLQSNDIPDDTEQIGTIKITSLENGSRSNE